MKELKPCPFCGKTNIDFFFDGHLRFIKCEDCLISTKRLSCDDEEYKQKLIIIWNRRD